MDHIPPKFNYVIFAARFVVIICSSLELLMMLSGSLEENNILAKLIYSLFLDGSVVVSAYNIALNIDGRDELQKVLTADLSVESRLLWSSLQHSQVSSVSKMVEEFGWNLQPKTLAKRYGRAKECIFDMDEDLETITKMLMVTGTKPSIPQFERYQKVQKA